MSKQDEFLNSLSPEQRAKFAELAGEKKAEQKRVSKGLVLTSMKDWQERSERKAQEYKNSPKHITQSFKEWSEKWEKENPV